MVSVNASGFPSASTIIWIFGGQASARTAHGLVDVPFFLRAPALC